MTSKDEFQRAVLRNSHLMLDNFGISVSQSDVPSAKDKQAALRALQPRGRIAQFLLWLQPKKQKELLREYNYFDALVQVERTNLILDKCLEVWKDDFGK